MNHRIKSLDGLRGILCLLVVFHHYDVKYIPSFFYNNFLIRQADLLVDFFFIISGFVISYNYKNFDSIKDVGKFLKKRFLRLYPLLLFSTTLFFLFEIFSRNIFSNFINKKIDNTSLIKSFIDTILLNNSSPLFGNSWGINRPTWSISAEFYAYLIFSIVLLVFGKRFKNIVLASVFIISGLSIFKLYNLDVFNNAEFGFIRCIYLFILGVFINYAKPRLYQSNKSIDLILVLFSIIALYINKIYICNLLHHTVIELIVMPVLFGTLIYYTIKGNGYFSNILSLKSIQWLGKYSYSIYLNHAIVILFIPKLIFQVLKLEKVIYVEFGTFVICILTTLIYSKITYKFVEKRFYFK